MICLLIRLISASQYVGEFNGSARSLHPFMVTMNSIRPYIPCLSHNRQFSCHHYCYPGYREIVLTLTMQGAARGSIPVAQQMTRSYAAGSVPATRREHDREELTPHDEDGNIDRKGTNYGSSVDQPCPEAKLPHRTKAGGQSSDCNRTSLHLALAISAYPSNLASSYGSNPCSKKNDTLMHKSVTKQLLVLR
jgi:hypothetical protein